MNFVILKESPAEEMKACTNRYGIWDYESGLEKKGWLTIEGNGQSDEERFDRIFS